VITNFIATIYLHELLIRKIYFWKCTFAIICPFYLFLKINLFYHFHNLLYPTRFTLNLHFCFTSEHKDLFGVEGKEDDVINIHKIANNVHDIKDDDVINIQNLAHNVRGISQTSLNDTSSTSHDSKNQVNNSRYFIDVKTEEF
jgi:hypothetical protein